MAPPAFDTHAYVKRLKAVGFNEAQAEAMQEIVENLATKEDLKNLEERFGFKIASVDTKINAIDDKISSQRGLIILVGVILGILTSIHGFFPNFHL